jgi:hypothetical protein
LGKVNAENRKDVGIYFSERQKTVGFWHLDQQNFNFRQATVDPIKATYKKLTLLL